MEEDHRLDDFYETVAAAHSSSCIAFAALAAVERGVDRAHTARQVGAEMLEDGTTPCTCGFGKHKFQHLKDPGTHQP